MKLHSSLVSLGIGICLSLSLAVADEQAWQQPLQNISKQVQANPENPRKNQAQIDTCLRTIRMSLSANDLNQAITQLNNLRNLEPTAVKPILKLSEQLIDNLVQRSKKDIERKENLYQEFAEALINAKAPKDIDPWLKKLNEEIKHDKKQAKQITPIKLWAPTLPNSIHSEGYRNFNSQSQLFSMNTTSLFHLQSQANQALQIARYWQDYMQYKLDSQHSSARSSMSSIAQIVVNFTYIPRSRVLDLQSELSGNQPSSDQANLYQIEDLQKRLNTQDEAVLLYNELSHASSSRLTPAVRALKNKLQVYNSACEYLAGGDLDDGYYKISTLAYHPILGKLSRQTHDSYLRRHLKIPESFQKNKKEEGAEWATRYILQLSKDHAWKDLHGALSMLQQYYYRSSGSGKAPIKEDTRAIGYLLAGFNYESNQQYLRAIVAYRQAVGTLGYCTEIINEAGKRLTNLQKAHPTEFAQSQSLSSHEGTSHSFTTSHLLIRKIVKEELNQQGEKKE